jgi:hypothetical protein
MLTSKDANFVGYTYKNSDVFKGMMNSPIGMTLFLPATNASVLCIGPHVKCVFV